MSSLDPPAEGIAVLAQMRDLRERDEGSAVTGGGVRDQLGRILSSRAFQEAPRLRQFLAYVVHETLEGRARGIKGFTIAQDVFGRADPEDAQATTIVPVEARRLRRQLAEYYEKEGVGDRIRIVVPKGSYVPVFDVGLAGEARDDKNVGTSLNFWKRVIPSNIATATSAALAVLLALVVGLWIFERPTAPQRSTSNDENVAPLRVDELSYKKVEAYSLFEQAWALPRPGSRKERIEASMLLAKKLVNVAPGFSGGHAVLAYGYSWSLMFNHSETPDKDWDTAMALTRKALSLDPNFHWSYIVLSRLHLIKGDHKQAVSVAETAVELQPSSPEANGNLGFTLMLLGEHERAETVLGKAVKLAKATKYDSYWNFLGITRYFQRNYHDALDAFQINNDRGGPIGPQNTAFIIASYVEMGKLELARALASRLREDYPDFALRNFFKRVFRKDVDSMRLISALDTAEFAIVQR